MIPFRVIKIGVSYTDGPMLPLGSVMTFYRDRDGLAYLQAVRGFGEGLLMYHNWA